MIDAGVDSVPGGGSDKGITLHVVATCRRCCGVMFVHLNLAPLTSETCSLREQYRR